LEIHSVDYAISRKQTSLKDQVNTTFQIKI